MSGVTTTTRIIIDTDILIDVGRGVQEALVYVQAKEQVHRVAISTITYLELLVGAQNKQEQQKIERFLQRFEHIRVNEIISDIAVDLIRQYRLSHGLLLADAMIAATAIALHVPLASKNQRDYRYITQLTLLPYLS
ncbi:MAG: type II toxin-antitoxin system VapC family toxin [Chloroflexia bacterium]|nr:type II toxin-antitoxin system VapC family toxin [Chloroflexia bacterium]